MIIEMMTSSCACTLRVTMVLFSQTKLKRSCVSRRSFANVIVRVYDVALPYNLIVCVATANSLSCLNLVTLLRCSAALLVPGLQIRALPAGLPALHALLDCQLHRSAGSDDARRRLRFLLLGLQQAERHSQPSRALVV